MVFRERLVLPSVFLSILSFSSQRLASFITVHKKLICNFISASATGCLSFSCYSFHRISWLSERANCYFDGTSHIERGSLKNFKSASPGDVIKCFYLRRFLGQFEDVNPFFPRWSSSTTYCVYHTSNESNLTTVEGLKVETFMDEVILLKT